MKRNTETHAFFSLQKAPRSEQSILVLSIPFPATISGCPQGNATGTQLSRCHRLPRPTKAEWGRMAALGTVPAAPLNSCHCGWGQDGNGMGGRMGDTAGLLPWGLQERSAHRALPFSLGYGQRRSILGCCGAIRSSARGMDAHGQWGHS